MAKTTPWHSTRQPFTIGRSELGGPDVLGGDPSVYHDDDQCPEGQKIPKENRAEGTGWT